MLSGNSTLALNECPRLVHVSKRLVDPQFNRDGVKPYGVQVVGIKRNELPGESHFFQRPAVSGLEDEGEPSLAEQKDIDLALLQALGGKHVNDLGA